VVTPIGYGYQRHALLRQLGDEARACLTALATDREAGKSGAARNWAWCVGILLERAELLAKAAGPDQASGPPDPAEALGRLRDLAADLTAGAPAAMASRSEILAYADHHGAKAAGERFGIPSGTIRSWRSRARKRAARDGTAPPSPAERWLAEARRIAERYARRRCLQCDDEGVVSVPAVTRGSLTIRKARRLVCPKCGGRPRHIEVVEHPRGAWLEGLAAAGDLGLGWNGREWAMIRAGEPHPDGFRWTGRDTPRRWPVTAQLQLPGYCWRCTDRRVLVVAATAIDRHGDRVCVEVLMPCPDCGGTEPGPGRERGWPACRAGAGPGRAAPGQAGRQAGEAGAAPHPASGPPTGRRRPMSAAVRG
jgi:hypothetical protein